MRIIFMGTPDFAVPCLDALIKSEYEVVGVFTQPDKPKGRGYELVPPPVKVCALENDIPVFQPASMRNGEALDIINSLNADLIIVVAFGKILPKEILESVKYGCINIHASLLPKLRGAAPIQWSILNGDSVAGVTSMQMDIGLDTGDMLSIREVPIKDDDNFENVHDNLGLAGAELLVETVEKIKLGEIIRIKQDDSLATYAAKIEKKDCLIDFSMSAKEVHDLIRGLSPIPLAFTYSQNGKMLKISSARISERRNTSYECGTVVSCDNDCITVACDDGCIDILAVLPEGKRRMPAADFIRGRGVSVGERFGK